MYTVTFFIISKMRKQVKCSLTEESINKMQCIQTMGYYIAIKGKKYQYMLSITNLEIFMLSEKSQSQKTTKMNQRPVFPVGNISIERNIVCALKINVILFMGNDQNRQIHRDRILEVAQGWDWGRGWGREQGVAETGFLFRC